MVLKFWLEFEESIGRVWDTYLNKKVSKSHDDARVYFKEYANSLRLFYHLLGGEEAKELHITDKRSIEVSRSWLEKISFLGTSFYLPWQDEKALYLPASLAYFSSQKDNEMLYYWLVAMLTRVDVNTINIEQ